MGIYFFLFALCWLPILLGRRPSKKTTILIFVGTAVFAGFRYETGYDWPVYSHLYETLSTPGIVGIISSPSFILLANLFKAVKVDFLYFQLFISLALSFFLYIALHSKARGSTYVSYLIYISIVDLFLIHQFSILRQGLALGCVWIGLRFYCERYKYWYLYILLAATFQMTALMTFAGVFLIFIVARFNWMAPLVLILGIFNYLLNLKIMSHFFSLISFNSEWVNLYFERGTFNPSILYKTYIFAWICISVFIVYRARFHVFICWPSFVQQRIIGISFAAPILYLLTYDVPTVSSRVSSFFGFGIVVLCAELLLYRRLRKRVLLSCLAFGLSLFMLTRFLNDPFSSVYVPYQTWFLNLSIENSTGLERSQKLIDNLHFLWGLQ